jgi:hypothetical protein
MKLLKRLEYSRSHQILMGSGVVITALLIMYLFTGGLTRIHSDSAGPLNLALEMIRTGEIFPDGWTGSTGVFTFQYPIWFFLQFVSDYLVAKAFAQTLWTIIFIISIIFASKKLLNNSSWIVALPLLLTLFSVDLQYDMLYVQCAYTATIFMTLYTIGFLGWALPDFQTWEVKKKRFLFTCCFLFASCALGIIIIEALLLPMLGSIVILYVSEYKDYKNLLTLPYLKRITFLLLTILVIGGIGYFCSLQLEKLLGVIGNPSASTLAVSIEQITNNILMVVQGILFYIGFPMSVSLFSINGILSIIRLVVFVAISIVFPVLAYKSYSTETRNTQFFLCFTLIHVIETLIIVTMTCMVDYTGVSRYLLTSIVLLNMVSANYIYTHYFKEENLMSFLYSVGISVVTVVMMFPAVKSISWYQPELDSMRGLTAYLQEQGLSYGYSSFWNAGINTALSNGKVQVNGVLVDSNQVHPYYWLSSKDWYEPEFHQGDSFLLLSSSEVEEYAPTGYSNTRLGEPDKLLNYGDFTILVYDHNIAENNFGGILDGSKNYIPDSMVVSDPTMVQEDQTIQIGSGQLMYGPYIDLDEGNYELTVISKLQEPQEIKITASAGAEQICSAILKSEMTVIPFALDSEKTQIEFVFQNIGNTTFEVSEIRLEKVN